MPPPEETVERGDPGCPKHMVYGPCSGVRPDLTCEVVVAPCPFAQRHQLERWPTDRTVTARSGLLGPAAVGRPIVVTDLSLQPFDPAGLAASVGAAAGSCDALLIGEHQRQPDFPPTQLVAMVRQAGGNPLVTLSCRDRNRVVLEQELAGLAQLGVDGVLCVTGDGRAPGIRPEVTQVFDLDGTRLAALAADVGLLAVVPEAPDAPPADLRPERLLQKQRAGAGLCILNHVGTAAGVARFVAHARRLGVTIPVLAAVAVYTDERSARVLQAFPGLHLDEDQVAAVLGAADPVAAGIAAAVAEARQLLAVDGIAGVNISGLGSDRGPLAAAEVKAAVGHALLAPT